MSIFSQCNRNAKDAKSVAPPSLAATTVCHIHRPQVWLPFVPLAPLPILLLFRIFPVFPSSTPTRFLCNFTLVCWPATNWPQAKSSREGEWEPAEGARCENRFMFLSWSDEKDALLIETLTCVGRWGKAKVHADFAYHDVRWLNAISRIKQMDREQQRVCDWDRDIVNLCQLPQAVVSFLAVKRESEEREREREKLQRRRREIELGLKLIS